ncbi:hypothetical protein FIV42_05655 [Persicimonas caeni]|uniref:P/Homo B domain-containing protein n=1 Tax=Persicimonas caeni TaxID=2292766 RepID=A0A4Y6PPG7_PERCE|nr:proprotein convertase P-domain-containing protein [Persicimonas caeni]QDG50232.1 hypothetical protein FIV42_05655 [Persicimonas caeni]QED31453.1 hypothetical protein FRD00_05650 [Persicimonas caeni]
MSKLRLLAWVGLLATALTPLYGCGSECAPGTTEKDGQCIVSSKGCAEGTVLMDGECVLDTSGCSDGTVFDNGLCVPAEGVCEEGTTFDQDTKTCVPNTDIVCGDGTEAGAEGSCVPSADACSDKTQLDANGRCVVAAAACGQGTELDPNTGDCVLAEAGCGTNLALDGDTGVCVPTADVCDAGTAFDSETGLCLPDACQEGDVLVNGLCMSPAEELALDFDLEEMEPNDPAFGAETELLTVPAVDGEPFVFLGNIDAPSDIDGDGSLDQDVDVYEFDAVQGDWFEIMVQSTGLQAPAFVIEGPNGYVRWSAIGQPDASARQMIAPEDGTYTVTVLPSLVLQTEGEVSLVGGDDWGYVGSFKAISAPAGTDADLSTGNASFSGEYMTLSDNVLNLTGLQMGDIVRVSLDASGDDVEGLLQHWDATGILARSESAGAGSSFEFVAIGNTATVLMDWVKLSGPDASFEVSAEITGEETTVTIPAGGTQTFQVTGEPYDQIYAAQTNTQSEDLKVSVVEDLSGTEIASEAALGSDESLKAKVENQGTYTVTFTNETSANVDATFTVKVLPPFDIGTLAPGDSGVSPMFDLPEGDITYVTFTVGAGELFRIGQDNAGDDDIEYALLDPSGTVVDDFTYVYDTEPSNPDYDWEYFISPNGGTYIVEVTTYVSSWSDYSTTDQVILVDNYGVPNDLGALTIDASATYSQPAPMARNAMEFHKLELSADGFVEFDVSTPADEDVDVYLFDDTLDVIEYSTSPTDEVFQSEELTAGTYYIGVHAWAALPSYDLSATLLGPITGSPDFSSAPAAAIPDDDTTTGVSDTITVTGCPTVQRVHLYVDITHPYGADVEIDLTSPDGTTVDVYSDNGGSTDDVVGWLPRPLVPDNSMLVYSGETGNGDWTLTVYDDNDYWDDTGGTFNEWGLSLVCQ